MLLRAMQRLVRLSPSTTRAVWARVPKVVQRALSPMIYPVAAGARAGAFVLDVPHDLARREYDVVVSGDALLGGAAAEWLAAERTAGRRVLVANASLEETLKQARVVDGIYVADTVDTAERLATARRFGLRVVSRTDLAPGIVAFPRVTVIVVTYAAGALVAACLRALLRNTPWPGLVIIVVVNGADDGTRVQVQVHAARDGVAVIANATNRGFAPAANQGLSRAAGDIVVLLNDDTAVGPAWLSRLVAHLESDEKLGLVSAVTNEIGNDAKIDVTYDSFDAMERFVVDRTFEHAGRRAPTETIALFCAAGRREVLQKAGLLDERYEVGMFEDDDLSRTLAASGFGRAIAHDAFVHHVGAASFGKLADAEYLAIWEANRKRFEQKWGVRWAPPEKKERA